MKKFLVIGFLMNLILIIAAYKLWGIILVLAVSLGVYKFMSTKFPNKSLLNEKLMFSSAYIIGCFAAHSLFGSTEITFFVSLIEAVFFIIFASL